MKQIVMTIAVAAAVLIGPARAEGPTPDTEGGRYIFSRQANGFFRLDTQSGAVSLCSEQPVGWACQAAPEDRAVFEREITRLQNENAALKRALLEHGLSLPPGVAPDAATGDAASAERRRYRSGNRLCRSRLAAFDRYHRPRPKTNLQQG
jgi:hypothetical protein